MNIWACMLCGAGLMVASSASAQTVYKWVDENGNVIYSQTLPPDRVVDEHERLTPDGLVAERVERAPTAEELASLKAQIAAARDEAERKRLQEQQDRLFLAAFPTVEDLERAREAQRSGVLAERRTVEALIAQLRAAFAQTVGQAAEYERRGERVPPWLEQQISNDRQRLAELRDRLAGIEQRLEQIEAEHAANVERHRRLTGASAGNDQEAG